MLTVGFFFAGGEERIFSSLYLFPLLLLFTGQAETIFEKLHLIIKYFFLKKSSHP